MNIRTVYERATTLTGDLQPSAGVVKYRSALSSADRAKLTIWGIAVLLLGAGLISWIISSAVTTTVSLIAVAIMVAIEVIRITQSVTLWAFARSAMDPIPNKPQAGLRVAVHTTIVPGKEPFDIVARTLLAMKEMHYAGEVDVWLLDEGDDPNIKRWCVQHDIHHFSRKGFPEWNMASGAFKAKTKHGNLNAFHDAYGHDYDIVAQMDPDHTPSPDFLERTLGYFVDANVGFVVAPQVYGNGDESWIAKASAFQAYVFHGVIQRGGNGMRAPLLIGTNHLVRTEALRDVGGYADNIIEDHLTSMHMFAKRNARNRYWKGVYTPDILSVGEGPSSFTDYFNQQKRWAYGIWEIMQKHSPRVFGDMRPAQRVAFTGLQFFYPSVAMSWVLSFVLSALIVTGVVELATSYILVTVWLASLITSLSFFWWLRKFNLVEHEQKDWGLKGMGLLLMCIPVYVAAGAQALMRKKLTYAVTAKGDLASPDTIRTFTPHLVWIGLIGLVVGLSFVLNPGVFSVAFVWLGWMTAVCASSLVVHYASARKVEEVVARSKVEVVPLEALLR